MYTFIKNLRAKAQEGFTLVELMVVVAIIGLLSAVAIPNFKKYQAKSKTSEAKLQLSAIYTAEQSFFMDYDYYGTCLNQMGFDPALEFLSRYYTVGFENGAATPNAGAVANGAPPNCSVSGTPNDTVTASAATVSTYAYGSGKKVAGTNTSSADLATTSPGTLSVPATGQVFTAGAIGIISTSATTAATADQWTIDSQKVIVQKIVGY